MYFETTTTNTIICVPYFIDSVSKILAFIEPVETFVYELSKIVEFDDPFGLY